jgi:hypothetical protein
VGWTRTIVITVVLLAAGRSAASSGEFTVQEATSAGEPIHSFNQAWRLLDGQFAASSAQTTADPYIDFTNASDFPGTLTVGAEKPRANQKFAVEITGQVDIPTAGTWSLGMISRGHANLVIDGKNLRSGAGRTTRVKPMTFDQAGIYQVSLTYFARTASPKLELYDSPGKFHRLHAHGADFQLVGDATDGGLPLAGGPSSGAGSPGQTIDNAAPIIITAGATTSVGPDSTGTGLLTTNSQIWSGGATYDWKINDGTGQPGSADGWDEISMSAFSVTAASPTSPITIAMQSLDGTIPGTPANVEPGNKYNWTIAHSDSQISVDGAPQSPANLLDTGDFALDTSGFTVDGSTFPLSDFQLNLVADGNGDDLQLTFAAVPEPCTAMLVGVCIGPMLLARRRAGARTVEQLSS